MTQKRFFAVLLAFFLALAACSSSDDTTDAAATGSSDSGSADGVSAGSAAEGDEAAPDTTAAPAADATTEETSDTDDSADDGTEKSTDGEATEAVGDVKRARLGDRILAQTSTFTSARFEAIIVVEGDPDLPEGAEFRLSGAYNESNNSSEVELDFGSLAAELIASGEDLGPFATLFEEPMVVRTVDNTAYISWALFSLFTGSDATWIATPVDDADDLTSTVGPGSTGSPVDFLSALEDADAEITVIGTEDVRGVSTTHYSALVDLEALDADLTEEERAALESEFGDLSTSAYPIEFWVDDDGQLRRYAMDLADVDGSAGSITFEIFDYGADIVIEAPPAEDVVSAEELDLQGLGF